MYVLTPPTPHPPPNLTHTLSVVSKATAPELKKYMDKRVQIKLNANRTITGVLRGFDPFM
jgi:hypothetical protein